MSCTGKATGRRMKRFFDVYFYDGTKSTISGSNYMDALQNSGLNSKYIAYYKEA